MSLELWNDVAKTDPAHTKTFKGRGGFQGTAIMPMYLIKRATEKWGPMGDKWGIRIISTECLTGAPIFDGQGKQIGNEILHTVQAEVFFPNGQCSVSEADEGRIPCFGQTMLVSQNRNGIVTDEEAPKKSLTDALTKGLSWLGFGADVHMGLYDDSKYLNQIKAEFGTERITKAQADVLNSIIMTGQIDIGRFLGWATAAAKMPVKAVEQLPADKFAAAKKILEDEAAKAGAA